MGDRPDDAVANAEGTIDGEALKGAVAAEGDDAYPNVEILTELLGADNDSVDLDTLFDAVQAVSGEGGSPVNPVETMGAAGGDVEGPATQVIDDGGVATVYNNLVDSGLGDADDFGLDNIIDNINPDA